VVVELEVEVEVEVEAEEEQRARRPLDVPHPPHLPAQQQQVHEQIPLPQVPPAVHPRKALALSRRGQILLRRPALPQAPALWLPPTRPPSRWS
jgi:hypothetical protein